MQEKSIEELIKEETAKRITEMERKDYPFPAPIGQKDVIMMVGLLIICIVLIALCMLGVIA
jgi:hypothetical protein